MSRADAVKKEMPLEDVLQRDPSISIILMAMGMDRVGLPLMRGRTLEDVCAEQRVDADEVTERINEFLRNKRAWEGDADE